jgi:hypothetical protein
MVLIRTLLAALGAAVALVASVPVLLVGLPFWVVSALTRLVGSAVRRGQPESVPWSSVIEFMPEIGWRNRPGARARVRSDRSFQVTLDDDGWRGSRSIDESEILVFGDSFAFGHGVDDDAFFADRTSGVKVKALGADGYNMVQGLLWMERLRDRLDGKLVVWFAFYGNDLMDNLRTNLERYRTPFVKSGLREGEWEIVTEHVGPEPWPFDPHWGYRDKIAEICTPGHHADRAFSACDFLIGRAHDLCTAAGARLVVVGIPDVKMMDPRELPRLRERSSNATLFDPGIPDSRLNAMCTSRGVPFVSLSGIVPVQDHLPNDCHWTAKGHGRVARLMERLAQDLLPREGPIAGARDPVGRTPPAPVASQESVSIVDHESI